MEKKLGQLIIDERYELSEQGDRVCVLNSVTIVGGNIVEVHPRYTSLTFRGEIGDFVREVRPYITIEGNHILIDKYRLVYIGRNANVYNGAAFYKVLE